MNEEIETCLARLHTKLDAIAILQAKLDAMEGHIGGLKVSVMNTTEDAMADADARLAEIEKRTPSCSGRGRTHATPADCADQARCKRRAGRTICRGGPATSQPFYR